MVPCSGCNSPKVQELKKRREQQCAPQIKTNMPMNISMRRLLIATAMSTPIRRRSTLTNTPTTKNIIPTSTRSKKERQIILLRVGRPRPLSLRWNLRTSGCGLPFIFFPEPADFTTSTSCTLEQYFSDIIALLSIPSRKFLPQFSPLPNVRIMSYLNDTVVII